MVSSPGENLAPLPSLAAECMIRCFYFAVAQVFEDLRLLVHSASSLGCVFENVPT